MRTLLVDDDPAFRRLAALALADAGVEHESVASAADAFERLANGRASSFDLVLLDQELPGMSGEDLLQKLRHQGVDIPIVLVTIHDALSSKVRALSLGADDYLVKPFNFEELLARLRAVVRRTRSNRPVRLGSVEIDPRQRSVTRDGITIDLTTREFEVLWILLQAQGRTVTRKEMLHRVWSMTFEPGTNFIQVHVSRLRQKLEPHDGYRIETVRGQGYRLIACPAPAPRQSSRQSS